MATWDLMIVDMEREWEEDEISFLKTIVVNLSKVIEGQEADAALSSRF